MKKMFLFAAAAMVSLSSCVQTNEVYTGELNEMGFKSAVTRGIIQTQDDMTYDIAVAAVWDSGDTGNYTTYFSALEGKFVYDSGIELWKGEPARYWPTSGDMQFLAMSPYPQLATIETNTNPDGTIKNMVVTGVNNNIVDQHDVIFSDLLCVEAPQPAASSLLFHHSLAQINVAFKKTDSAAAVVVKSVRLKNIYLTGSLTITPGAITTNGLGEVEVAPSTAAWENGLITGCFFLDAASTSNEQGTLDYTLTTSYTSLVPQLVMPSTQGVIEIVYTIDGVQQIYEHNLTLDQHDQPIVPTPTWEMGYKYTYNYTINVNEIMFDCDVDEWKTPVVDGGSTTI